VSFIPLLRLTLEEPGIITKGRFFFGFCLPSLCCVTA